MTKFFKLSTWKRWIVPSEEQLKNHPRLQFLSHKLHNRGLWHLTPKSVPRACGIGIFFSFIPLPTQMLMAAICSILLNGNVILAVALVWISNPFTMPFIFYGCYELGKWLLHSQTPDFHHTDLHVLMTQFKIIWPPFITGCLAAAIAGGLLAYCIALFCYRNSSEQEPQQ